MKISRNVLIFSLEVLFFSVFFITLLLEKHPSLFSKEEINQVVDVVKSSRFEKAFANLIKEEGGYVNHPNDKGGETKYGISKRSYPRLDIKHLTLNQAKDIYKKDFWDAIKGDELPSDEVACEALEQAVNMGIKTAVSFLQVVCVSEGNIDMVVDGRMGKQTLQALNRITPSFILVAIKALAIAHYLKLAREEPPMKVFLKGWIKRVTS